MPTMDDLFELRVQIDTELTSGDKRVKNRAKKIGRMHRLHGAGPEDARCDECRQFAIKRGCAKDYPKCRLFGISGGPGTDWQRRWPACGKFEPRVAT